MTLPPGNASAPQGLRIASVDGRDSWLLVAKGVHHSKFHLNDNAPT